MGSIFSISDVVDTGIQAGATIASSQIQADAINNATNAQKEQFAQITANNKPFLDTGTSALDRIATHYGLNGKTQSFDGFTASPDYQFRFDQGMKGVDAGARYRGMADSGATRKAEIAYAGNLASGEYNSYANRLMDLAKVGQGAANNQATAGQNYAANVGNLGVASANGTANAINGFAGKFSSSYGGRPSVPQSTISDDRFNIGNAGYTNTVRPSAGF